MAKIIYPDGTTKDISPANGNDFSLEELQKIVEGYIELVYLNERIMVINEEGKFKELPYNAKATDLYRKSRRTIDFIVGNALICNLNEMK